MAIINICFGVRDDVTTFSNEKKEKITPINQYNSVKMMCVSVGRVTVRFNDSAVRVGYSAGWLFTNTDDIEYTITLGPEEDGSESFLGGMANLIIDDRSGSKKLSTKHIKHLLVFSDVTNAALIIKKEN